MQRRAILIVLAAAAAGSASAQFTGPSARAPASNVAQLGAARLGSYVTLTGNVVAHERGDYYTFRDGSGDIRVEIEPPVWRNRKVGADTKVRLVGEVDQGQAGRYIWVKSLELVE